MGLIRPNCWRLGLLVLAFVLAGCAQGVPTPTPAPSPTVGASPTVQPGATATSPARQTPAASPQAAVETGEPYRIGAVLSLTGPAAPLGVPQRNALELLRDEVNKQGGVLGPDGKRHPLEIIIYDDQSQPSQAVLAVTRLIEQDRVPAVICCATSGASVPAVDVVQRAQIPMVATASSQAITNPPAERRWAFKPTWDGGQVAEGLLRNLQRRGISRVALLSVANEFGESGKIAFEQLGPRYGITLSVNDTFNAGVTDLTPQLVRVRASDAEALVVYANIPEVVVALKNMRDLGMEMPVYLTNAVASPAFLQAAGETAEGAIVQTGKVFVYEGLPDSDPQKAVIADFVRLYQARYGTRPDAFAGHAYDAFWLIVQSLEKAGPNPAGIRDAIEGTSRFVGITGVLTFSPTKHTGFNLEDMVLAVVEGGQFRLLAD
ncbi:MAG: ABC transporter substrate-binding protein [Thermomicrobium sp.]|nr:ABC transporter substrate-binding protein [Thermomicrobium sp.]